MGNQMLDQYSLLHVAVGILTYFWSVPFWLGLFVHAFFEWAENTEWGVAAINRYIIDPGYFKWPGGKYKPDDLINSMGDNLNFAVGWLLAAWLDDVGTRRGWYDMGRG